MLLRMAVALSLNWRGQGSRKTSLRHLKKYRGGKCREIRLKCHFLIFFFVFAWSKKLFYYI